MNEEFEKWWHRTASRYALKKVEARVLWDTTFLAGQAAERKRNAELIEERDQDNKGMEEAAK